MHCLLFIFWIDFYDIRKGKWAKDTYWIFLKIMILKSLTSYEINIQANLPLVQNSTALTFFYSKGSKQILALQTGSFSSVVLFILCSAMPFINYLLSKEMLYTNAHASCWKQNNAFTVLASFRHLVQVCCCLKPYCVPTFSLNTKIQFVTTQIVRAVCLSWGCTQVWEAQMVLWRLSQSIGSWRWINNTEDI